MSNALTKAHNKPPKKIPKNLGMTKFIRQKEDEHYILLNKGIQI
jgi:hypothetical protein